MILLNPDTVLTLGVAWRLRKIWECEKPNCQSVYCGWLWHAVYVNWHLVTINSVLVTQVFLQWILPQWAQFIKKLRIMGFDSWNWKKPKQLLHFWCRNLCISWVVLSQKPPSLSLFIFLLLDHIVWLCDFCPQFVPHPLSDPSASSWRGIPAPVIIPLVLISFLRDNKWEWRGVK